MKVLPILAIVMLLSAMFVAVGKQPNVDAQAANFKLFIPGLAANPAGAPPGVSSFTVHFIDVGQGDATLISAGGQRMLVDGGRSQSGIRQRLESLAVADLDAIVATHSDADHIAGLIEVLEMYAVESIYLTGDSSDSQTYTDFMTAVNAEGAQVTTARRGMTIPLGGLQISVLHPPALTGDNNADSIVLDWQCGAVGVMLTGDATITSEASMLAAGVIPDIDVLKLGHHGSDTSTSQAFLDATSPDYAIVSAGLGNQYGHPHASVLERVWASGAMIYLTDRTSGDDTIEMTSDCSFVSFSEAPIPHPTITPSVTPTPTTTLTPTATPSPTVTATPAGNCDAAYPDFCIPPPPPDLDCGDIGQTNFTVLPPDPHGFDGNHDGVGCES